MNKGYLWAFILIPLALVGLIEGIRLNRSEPVETAPISVLSELRFCHLFIQTSRQQQGVTFLPKTCKEAREKSPNTFSIPLLLAATEIEYDQGEIVTIRGQTTEGRWYQVDTRDGRNLKVVPVTR